MKLVLACSGTLLLVLLAACESANNGGGTSSPTLSSPTGSRPPRPGSSSGGSSGFDRPDEPPPPDDFGCPMNTPLSESDLDKEIGWKAGAPAQGSCTATELEQIAKNFSDTSIQSYFDLANDVSETCRSCVVSKDTDATWGPIVGTAENDGETGFVNYGACFGAIEGAPCGKAIQYQTFCENIACNECAFTTKERGDCIAKAIEPGQMCATFSSKRTTACPSWTLNVKSCGDIQKAIETLCGPPQ